MQGGNKNIYAVKAKARSEVLDKGGNENIIEMSNNKTCVSSKDASKIILPLLNRHRYRRSVRNQVPKPKPNIDFYVWVSTYHVHLTNMYDIFGNCIDRFGLSDDEDMFYKFTQLIFNSSSGEISPNV